MKQTDRYNILGTATELMLKHMDLSTVKQSQDIEASLKKAYKTAETALLTHTRQQVAQIKTISALTDCFVDTCYGLGSLGLRSDLIRNKLIGEPKSGQESLREAITKDTNPENPLLSGLEEIQGFEAQDAFNLSVAAYNDGYYGIINDTNYKALTYVYFWDYLQNNGIALDMSVIAADLHYSTCLKAIIGRDWAERPLVGYYTDDTYYKSIVNTDFTSIFASKLRALMAQASKDSIDYFKALHIGQYLHKVVVRAYCGCKVNPVEVYAEIDRLIVAYRTPEGITQAVVDDTYYSNRFTVVTKHGSHGVSYELNIDSLQSLAGMLEALGLDELPEVSVMIGKIRASMCT